MPKTKQQPKINLLGDIFKPKVFGVFIFAALFASVGLSLLFISNANTANRKPPGTYTWWTWPGTNYKKLEAGLRIEKDPTKVLGGVGYYWANQFKFTVGDGGYVGVQTNGAAHSHRGKIAIFSIFGPAIQVRNGSAGSECFVDRSNTFDGYEMNGSSCRLPLNWKEGETYLMQVQQSGRDANGTLWTAAIVNAAPGSTPQVIGTIWTPPNWGNLMGGQFANWTEYYSAGRPTCDAPASSVTFLTPKMDGITATGHDNIVTTPAGHCGNSRVTDVSGGVRQEQAYNGPQPMKALPTGGVYLSDLPWKSGTSDYAPVKKDMSHNDQPIKINGVTYAKGLGVNSTSQIVYDLAGKYSKFLSWAGIQDGAYGKTIFEVFLDGQKVFTGTNAGQGDPAYPSRIELDVTGKKELKLIVRDAGDGKEIDWGNWGDARLIVNPNAQQPVQQNNQTQNQVQPQTQQQPVDANAALRFNTTFYDYMTKKTVTRTGVDAAVNFDWGTYPPVNGIGADYFHAIWEASFKAPATGRYAFTSLYDDGFGLLIDGKVVIDKWNNPAVANSNGVVNLLAGKTYKIMAMSFDAKGPAKAILQWSGPGITGSQVFPRLNGSVIARPPAPPRACTNLLIACL